MTVFWLLVTLLTLAGVAALVVPLVRRAPARPDTDERQMRLDIYRDRKHEIERERSAGRMTEDEAKSAIDDLAGDAAENFSSTSDGLADKSTSTTTSSALSAGHPRRPNGGLAIALSIAIPILAVIVYLGLGAPSIVGIDPDVARGQASPDDVVQAIGSLERRVREQPDDVQAWTMLAQARRVQGNLGGAAQAFAEATRLQPRDGRLLAEYAETVVASRDGDFSGQPEQLLEQALKLSPREPKALALMGAAQYRLGRPERALGYLRTLLQDMDPKSEQAQQIQQVADRLAAQSGASSGVPAQAGASADGGSTAARIAGRVSVSPALAARLEPGATLFVSARLPEGPRMPLAAIRLAGVTFPTEYSLSDAQAMSPDRRLSQAEQVVIEARISRSGTAIRQPGDLIGVSGVVKPGAVGVNIQIDQVVP